VLAYIWGGLTEAAGIAAVAVNKLPNAVVTIREGARALDPGLDEMARVFKMPPWRVFRHVVLPQLAPYIAAAGDPAWRWYGRSSWSSSCSAARNGVGFEIGIAFQLFDVTALAGLRLGLRRGHAGIETFLVQPLERHASRWRARPA